MNNIEKTYNYLVNSFDECAYFNQEGNESQREYRLKHSFRVANIAKEIATKEGLNVEAFVIGGLLHDIGYCHEFKDGDDYKNHGRYGAKVAKDFIMSLDIDEQFKQEILYGIAAHVDGKSDVEGVETVLSETISDCDNIDRFDCYRLHENLEYAKFTSKPFDEQLEYVTARIKRLKELKEMKFATETGTMMWISNLDYQIEFCVKLLNQLNSSEIVFE